MDKNIKSILTDLQNKIQLKQLHYTGFKDIPPIVSLLENGFHELRVLISNHQFDSKADEIYFFKETKPQLASKLIYYQRMYNIEIKRSLLDFNLQRCFLKSEQENLHKFYESNIDFVQYYRSGKTFWDESYFLREHKEVDIYLDDFYFERNPKFSTHSDFRISEILASELLLSYIEDELNKLEQQPNINVDNIHSIKPKGVWTDTKNALVELIYAIHTEKSINYGNIDLKVLTAMFEKIFNISLGDVYRTYLDLRGRKGDRTVYLNRLIQSLNKRMDDIDNR